MVLDVILFILLRSVTTSLCSVSFVHYYLVCFEFCFEFTLSATSALWTFLHVLLVCMCSAQDLEEGVDNSENNSEGGPRFDQQDLLLASSSSGGSPISDGGLSLEDNLRKSLVNGGGQQRKGGGGLQQRDRALSSPDLAKNATAKPVIVVGGIIRVDWLLSSLLLLVLHSVSIVPVSLALVWAYRDVCPSLFHICR